MGTKKNPGAFDCYANAADDEPMFILLGRDPLAPLLISMWAAVRRSLGESSEKTEDALVCARACEEWAKALGKEKAAREAFVAWMKVLQETAARFTEAQP